ncbi:hypothetical protein GCM10009839_40290 [Catenulispora yoronensis]|uniref:Uncharacterized protein n=1 Tax=Catenulispora yoronensis TaxID=450799 RepID=A0ABN2UGB0_9ACTN
MSGSGMASSGSVGGSDFAGCSAGIGVAGGRSSGVSGSGTAGGGSVASCSGAGISVGSGVGYGSGSGAGSGCGVGCGERFIGVGSVAGVERGGWLGAHVAMVAGWGVWSVVGGRWGGPLVSPAPSPIPSVCCSRPLPDPLLSGG